MTTQNTYYKPMSKILIKTLLVSLTFDNIKQTFYVHVQVINRYTSNSTCYLNTCLQPNSVFQDPYLIVGAVTLSTLATLEQVCLGALSHSQLVVINPLLGELLSQSFHLITGHFLQRHHHHSYHLELFSLKKGQE